MRLYEYFAKWARGRGVMMADQLAETMRQIVSKPGNPRVRATPFAPPRRITGRLQRSITVIRTARGASVQVYASYASILEKSTHTRGFPHKFLAVALKKLGLKSRSGN